MNILALTNTNLIDPDNPPTLTAEDISERIYGSKLVLVVEQMQIATVWLIKCCLLIMYARLTLVRPLQLIIDYLGSDSA